MGRPEFGSTEIRVDRQYPDDKLGRSSPGMMPRVGLLLGLCLAHVTSSPGSVGTLGPGGDVRGGCWRERGTAGAVQQTSKFVDPLDRRRLSLRGGGDDAARLGSGIGKSRRTFTAYVWLKEIPEKPLQREAFSPKDHFTRSISLALILDVPRFFPGRSLALVARATAAHLRVRLLRGRGGGWNRRFPAGESTVGARNADERRGYRRAVEGCVVQHAGRLLRVRG